MSGSRRDGGEQGYRSILRGTSAFGGVQVFQILVSLVRGKLVALFLGPAGMGVVSLYTTAVTTVQRVASLGLNLAVVKEVGAAKDDPARLAPVTAAARTLLYSTALLGALVCLAAAPWLSDLSFGSGDHTGGFALLSVMVFFSIAGAGEMSFLQGLREARRLMWSSVVGSVTGLCVSVPLYWLFGMRGIVPAMIILAGAVFAFNYRSVRRAIGPVAVRFLWSEHKPLVRTLVATGLVLMASDAIGSACQYALNALVRMSGGLRDVGLYQAANSLTLQYSGVVFAALAMDYLPRLAGVARSDRRLSVVVNRQAEVVAWVAAPLGALLVLFAPLAVRLLLTAEFGAAVSLLRWMGVALTLKALMFPLGYITFAKDNRRVFFWLEGVWGNAMMVLLGYAGYRLWGITGLGYAQAADCVISLAVYYAVNRRLYNFRYSRRALAAGAFAALSVAAVFGLSFIGKPVQSYAAMSVVTAAVCLVSGRSLLRLWRR